MDYFWAIFVFFLYLFRIFGARPGVGDFVFFVFFSDFFRISELEGFLSSIPGTRDHNILCVMARASLHRFYVMTLKLAAPRIFYVMANPINYTHNSGFLSAIF